MTADYAIWFLTQRYNVYCNY